jgi:DNA-binding MarR family transcriptional regulator
MHPVSAPRSNKAKGSAPAADSAHEVWGRLAALVYPPPFLAIARELGLRPIAIVLHCDNSNVTGIVDGLEEKGLATRRPSAADRRVKLIELTAEGRKVRARLIRAIEKPPAWVEGLSKADRRGLVEILGRAIERSSG